MAGGSLLALLDDIASILDDVATMTTLASKRAAGVISDDLALNAEQLIGTRANREIPVVLKVAKGSMINKLIIIASVLVLGQLSSLLITLLLVSGGLYLCYEGAEKNLHSMHKLRHSKHKESDLNLESVELLSEEEEQKREKQKIRGAIRTDFILSAEIIIIAMDVMLNESLFIKITSLIAVSLIVTVGVYGFVTLIIKLDDMGYWLMVHNQTRKWLFNFGKLLLNSAPYLMKLLSIIGTIAMLLVGGGIVLHNIDYFHQLEYQLFTEIKQIGSIFQITFIVQTMITLFSGLLLGFLCLFMVSFLKRCVLRNKQSI